MVPMRLSSLCFLMPTYMAWMRGLDVGVYVMLFVTMTSIIVHRPLQCGYVKIWRDYLDYVAIGCWVCYNGYLVVFYQWTWFAIICVFVCSLLNLWRNELAFPSDDRFSVHILMHMVGALGTTILFDVN